MEHPKENDVMPDSINEDDLASPRPNGGIELEDMTTKHKLMGSGPGDHEVDHEDVNLDHSFDEDDLLSPSPDRKAEVT